LNALLLLLPVLVLIPLVSEAYAANPNLYVSAENQQFGNHFAGSMVVEVVVSDPALSDTGEGKGEPNVTINGKTLRMVQATDGRWYGYFTNSAKARIADATVTMEGKGLDFGQFCTREASSLGVSFTQTDGIAVPRSISGGTNGDSGFGTCTGLPSGNIINNVVRYPRSINTNPNIPSGQIGLDPAAWPIIQLYSFSSNVVIQYNGAGGTQSVTLQYNDIPNISLELDRPAYPPGSEVFATIRDMQLNQDPTARDSWTFNVGSPQAVFYSAFTENGGNAANQTPGLANIESKLSNIGFSKNGKLTMSLGNILQLKQNQFQSATASDTFTIYDKIVTFVETEPNSGIFMTADYTNTSNMGVLSSAPRGQAASIQYNSKSTSILSGLATATMSLGTNQLQPGQKVPLSVTDQNQNTNNGVREILDVSKSSTIIPTLVIGNPLTLKGAGSVKVYLDSADSLAAGTAVPSSIPDLKSARLFLDARSVPNQSFEKISINLNVGAQQLNNLLINTSSQNHIGTNWVNYDFRSLEQLGISDYADASIQLFFGLGDTSPVTLVPAGQMTGARGLIQIPDGAVAAINSKSGAAFLVVNFDASNNSSPQGAISSESDTQPIVFDIFSFGQKGEASINNAIYRFELRETTANSATFSGTVEYVMASQLNQSDPNLIKSLRPISEDVKFFVNQRLIDERGVNISYSDLDATGTITAVSTKTDIQSHTGTVTLGGGTIRFGSTVTVVLVDPDLNVNNNAIDTYHVINDPTSPYADAVGGQGGKLLEVMIKGIPYKRCTINGVEHGGLGATGFALVETGPSTGRFEGTFKMPSQICNERGTELISAAGGIIDVRYYDFRDSMGQQRTITLSRAEQIPTQPIPVQPTPVAPQPTPQPVPTTPIPTMPKIPTTKVFSLPQVGKTTEIFLTGKVHNYVEGTMIEVLVTAPDGKVTKLEVTATKQGNYKAAITLKDDSPTGRYAVDTMYQNYQIGKLAFGVADFRSILGR
jgi:hypothetical protein